uniref:LYR motif-containing protein 2 n=1 Tax=Neovison vison TaxID=452646 RepID=A0A8C7EJC2_NEOVI
KKKSALLSLQPLVTGSLFSANSPNTLSAFFLKGKFFVVLFKTEDRREVIYFFFFLVSQSRVCSCNWHFSSLLQFMRRQQVLLLYRRILQAIREVPNDSDRKYLKDWAREEFKRNKSATEEDTIRMMITQGNMQLKELEKNLALAKS